MSDARFEDAGESRLALRAQTAQDIPVLAALLQDAILSQNDMRYDRRARRFGVLLNRFRWEDQQTAERLGRPYERVRALLIISDVRGVATQALERGAGAAVLSILDLAWQPGEDGTGKLVLTLAGDGAIALDVECIDIALRDVTRPYLAPSRRAPQHPE
jgi:hypothetical protein